MAKKRLLIVEDDTDVAEMLLLYFTGQGYDVLHALTGGEGIAAARAKFPNLILLDVMLPDMDGFDVCRTLRTTILTKFIPTIFLTQRDNRSDKIAGLELGADDYVTKPFDIEELLLRVQSSIRHSTREMLQDARTGLPTGALVEEMQRQIEGKPGWMRLEIQLAGLSAFRDLYGFIAADEALAYAAQSITAVTTRYGSPEDFIGSVNEDRFIVLTRAADLNVLSMALADNFKDGVKKFYNFVDGERGFMLLNDSEGIQQRMPLMRFMISPIPEGAQAAL